MDKKIYYVSPFTWILPILFFTLAAFFLFFAVIAIPQILTMDNSFDKLLLFFAVIGLLLFIVYAALVVSDVPTTRLELSEEGLIFYSTGYRIYTPWENIAALGWMPASRAFPGVIQLKKSAAVSGLSFAEGILNRQPIVEKRSWWQTVWQIKTFVRYRRSIRIPVVIFRKKDKQDGSINQHLQYYLPHVVENS